LIYDETIYEENLEEDLEEEDLDETYDEDEEFSLSLDEDIQIYSSPAHQEENMMSYNHFENFDDDLFHNFGNEENFQKDLDEVSLAEGMNETLLSSFPFEENEIIQSCEEVINSYDANEIMEQPPDIVDDHIDDFIQTGRGKWGFGCFIFYEDTIYDIESTSQIKDTERISSEDLFLYPNGPYMCQPDDMVTHFFHPFKDDLTLHFQDDFQPPYLDFDRH
jgi:hypothetical protein